MSTETVRLIRHGEKGRMGYGGGGRGRLYTYHYIVTTRLTSALRWAAMRAILMFHNCEGQSHKTLSTDHNLWSERRAEADSNRGASAYQPNALGLGQTGSQKNDHKHNPVNLTLWDAFVSVPGESSDLHDCVHMFIWGTTSKTPANLRPPPTVAVVNCTCMSDEQLFG